MQETSYQRIAREQAERKAARAQKTKQCARKPRRAIEPNYRRIADRIDGYDRDDLGESPDY